MDGRAAAWLSLDQRDNDPALFWTYVVAAVQTASPAVGASAVALVASPQSSTEAIVATLLNELHGIRNELVSVLDDYHLIEAHEVHEGMADLLANLPSQMRLVIASARCVEHLLIRPGPTARQSGSNAAGRAASRREGAMSRVTPKMTVRRWRSSPTIAIATLVVLCLATPASGRHNFSMLKVNPELGIPGGEVSVNGFSYPTNVRVSIRFNALDGPVLAELDPTANQDISGSVRIPPDTASGRYVLYAVQYDSAGKPNRIPGRGALTVAAPGVAPPAVPAGLELESRPKVLVRSDGASPGQLALVALLAFTLAGLLGVLMARVVTSRKSAAPEVHAP